MMKKLLLLKFVLLVLFSTGLNAQSIFIDTVHVTRSINCFVDNNGDGLNDSLADIDVVVDNDTNTLLGGSPSYVPYQLKIFKSGCYSGREREES